MSYGEVFLLVWALGATAVAVVVHHRAKRYRIFEMIAEQMLIGLLKGTATMVKTPTGGAKFINRVEENEDVIVLEPRRK